MAVTGVGGVFQDVVGFLETAGVVQFSQRGEGASYDLLGKVYDPLKCLPLCGCAALEPHTSAVCEDAFDGAPIEGHKQVLGEAVLPEDSQEVQSLVCLLDRSRGVRAPCLFASS